MQTVASPVTLRRDSPLPETPLWTLARGPYLARCDLRQQPRAWELCVSIDDQVLLSRECATQVEAGALSGGWRLRLSESGWSPLTDPTGSD